MVQSFEENTLEEVLRWCTSVLGPVTVVSDPTREHAGKRASVLRLRTTDDYCYLKIHHNQSHWENEVHGYSAWAQAFGDCAPRLLAVRETMPLGLIISELPGRVLEDIHLPNVKEEKVWRSAGRALATLHNLSEGDFFGPCRKDGSPAAAPIYDACEYISKDFEHWLERGDRIGCLGKDEIITCRLAYEAIPVFFGEPPVPSHRDYCTANWLVNDVGDWIGVIDFEFSGWDVRAADFARFHDWKWIKYPRLMEAFLEGYNHRFTQVEQQQQYIAHAQYALSAIVWGSESEYYGFAAEGRQALQYIGALFR